MQTFFAILLVTVLALLASSTMGFRLRRTRLTAALFGGGWVAIGVGAAIGPRGLGAVTLETIHGATPLVVLGLGWIGMMIGLQAQRAVLRQLPGSMVRVSVADTALTLVVFGVAGWFGVRAWAAVDGAAAWTLGALVACASLGWTMETRSLSAGDEAAGRAGAMTIRGAGGLASIVTVVVFGVVYSFSHHSSAGSETPVTLGIARLGVAAAFGLVSGLIGRFALREAAGVGGASLAVLLGLVSLVGGLAYELDLSPLFVACVAGAVIANLAGVELRSFERVILRAEHAVAAMFAMLAGALLDPAIGLWGVGLAALLAGLRLAVKPQALRASATVNQEIGGLRWAVVRQSPVAVALVVSVVVHDTGDVWAARLLAVVVLAGLLAELLPLLATWMMRRHPMGTAVVAEAPVETEDESAADPTEEAGGES